MQLAAESSGGCRPDSEVRDDPRATPHATKQNEADARRNMLQQRLSQRQQPQSSGRSKEGAARSPPKGADDADARRNMLQERLSEKVQKKQSTSAREATFCAQKTVSNDSRPTSAREAGQRPAAKPKPQLNSEQLIQGSQRVPSRYESSTTAVSSSLCPTDASPRSSAARFAPRTRLE